MAAELNKNSVFAIETALIFNSLAEIFSQTKIVVTYLLTMFIR